MLNSRWVNGLKMPAIVLASQPDEWVQPEAVGTVQAAEIPRKLWPLRAPARTAALER